MSMNILTEFLWWYIFEVSVIIQVDAVNLNESVCKPKSEYFDNASAYGV